MAIGDIYRAIKGNEGGFSNIGLPILQYFVQKQQDEEKKQYLNDIFNAFKSTQKKISDIENTGLESSTITSDVNQASRTPSNIISGVNDLNNAEQPSYEQLGNYLNPNERTNEATNLSNDFLIKALFDPRSENVDAGKLNLLMQMLRNRTEGMRPKEPNFKQVDPTKDIVDWNTLKVVKPGIPKEESVKLEGTFKNPKTGTYWKYDQKNRTGVDTHIPYDKGEGKTTVNVNTGYKEKSLKESTAKLIADLKNYKPYTTDEFGTKHPKDLSDIKYEKDNTLENIKLQLLSPRVYQFVNNIERLWRENDKTGTRQYLSPSELKNEAEKHYLNGEITENDLRELKNYLQYYSKDIYNGLIKKYNPPPKEKPNEEE